MRYLAMGACAVIACFGATPRCDDDVTASEKRRVRSLLVESRWNSLSQAALSLHSGDLFSPDKLSDVFADVLKAIGAQDAADIANRGLVDVRFVTSCVVRVEPDLVDVIIRPWVVRIDRPSGVLNSTAQPRSNEPQLRSGVPPTVRAINPTAGIRHDRALGTTLGFGFATSLGELPRALNERPDAPRKHDLEIWGNGQRSMDADYYTSRLGLRWVYQPQSMPLRRITVESSGAADRGPLGSEVTWQNSFRNAITYRTLESKGPGRGLGISAGYRWSGNRLAGPRSQLNSTDQVGEARVLADLRLPVGVARFDVASDFGTSEAAAGNFARLVGRAGYSAEIPVGGTQAIGIETQFSGGRTWGSTPTYLLYYGGNHPAYILDQGFDATLQRPFLSGPTLRGFGQSQVSLAPSPGAPPGASSFVGLNLDVAFPVPLWSRPLIPNVATELGPTLGQMIERAGLNSSENGLASYYQSAEGMTEADAVAKAKREIDSIRPAVHYLAQYAKLYAVRPLLMFDAAYLSGTGRSRTAYSAGAGVQLMIVIAKLQAGYAWAINRLPGEAAGNFVFRLSFLNLF